MEMFLTRIGDNCKVIINGDLCQSDIKGLSGLADGMSLTKKIGDIDIVEFTLEDIVRGGLCQEIVYAYAERRENRKKQSEGWHCAKMTLQLEKVI